MRCRPIPSPTADHGTACVVDNGTHINSTNENGNSNMALIMSTTAKARQAMGMPIVTDKRNEIPAAEIPANPDALRRLPAANDYADTVRTVRAAKVAPRKATVWGIGSDLHARRQIGKRWATVSGIARAPKFSAMGTPCEPTPCADPIPAAVVVPETETAWAMQRAQWIADARKRAKARNTPTRYNPDNLPTVIPATDPTWQPIARMRAKAVTAGWQSLPDALAAMPSGPMPLSGHAVTEWESPIPAAAWATLVPDVIDHGTWRDHGVRTVPATAEIPANKQRMRAVVFVRDGETVRHAIPSPTLAPDVVRVKGKDTKAKTNGRCSSVVHHAPNGVIGFGVMGGTYDRGRDQWIETEIREKGASVHHRLTVFDGARMGDSGTPTVATKAATDAVRVVAAKDGTKVLTKMTRASSVKSAKKKRAPKKARTAEEKAAHAAEEKARRAAAKARQAAQLPHLTQPDARMAEAEAIAASL